MATKKIDGEAVTNVKGGFSTWGRALGSYDEVGTVDIARLRFLSENSDQEAFTVTEDYTTAHTMIQVADSLVAKIGGHITGIYKHSVVIVGKLNEHPVFAVVGYGDRSNFNYSDDDDEELPTRVRHIQVTLTSHRQAHKEIYKSLEGTYGKESYVAIRWWHREDGGPTNRVTYLPPLSTKLLPEFYPDLPETPQEFIRGFLKSDAAILLLSGPPGTGKTTFLRHMISENKLSTHVVYDEALMQSDKVFQSFLFEKNSDLLVIEDADTILLSREHDTNKLMARFLNVSDGLIKLPDKKLVFTTNLSDFGKIDSALTRPGRCYGVMHTRHLNLTEAQAAAKATGLPIPMEKREYTLAELFNQGAKKHAIRRVGF